MRCAICGKITRNLKNDLCFRCYVMSRAIRLEPEMPYSSVSTDSNHTDNEVKQRIFMLKPFVTDVQMDQKDQ